MNQFRYKPRKSKELDKEKCHVVKIGGKLIDDKDLYHQFLNGFGQLEGSKILVHGGGKMGSEVLDRMDIPVRYHEGRRITDRQSMDVLVMVYAGSINKSITADLQSLQCNAIGLSGCDLNIIRAVKRPVKEIDYGYAGDIQEINVPALNSLLKMGAVPVISPITHNLSGQLLNTNADTIAAAISAALADSFEVELHYCFELIGVLEDIKKEYSLIRMMNYLEYLRYRDEGTIHKGMLPKLSNAFTALQNNVHRVTIGDPDHFLRREGHTVLVNQ